MNSSYPVFNHVFAGALSLFSQDRWAGQPNVTKKPEVEIENERVIADCRPRYLSLKYLSPAAISLKIRIAGCRPRYLSLKYLSPAAISLKIRIAGCRPRYLVPKPKVPKPSCH